MVQAEWALICVATEVELLLSFLQGFFVHMQNEPTCSLFQL